jgi:hypothetical protein
VFRPVLAVLVCLCLQVSAISAPLVHVHADADHETDHHNGHVVHSHMTVHLAPVGHDHEETEAGLLSGAEDSSVIGSAESGAFVLAAPMVAGKGDAGSLVVSPAPEIGLATPLDSGAIPPDRAYWQPSSPPGPSTFALRGPPQ